MPTINKNPVGQPVADAGAQRTVIVDYTGPASYATGGDAFAAGNVSLGRLYYAPSFAAQASAGGTVYLGVYDYTNGKYVWYTAADGLQVGAATDLSGVVVRLAVVGLP